MFINWKTRELNLNIVYTGPALSGKTTNLEQIHAHMAPTVRSDLFTLNTHEDRTIFFDFLQIEIGQVSGLKPKFGLYTVPGQVYYESTRQAVLRRADSVVFVIDSQIQRLEDNRQAWNDLARHLAGMGLAVTNFPLLVQYNKRDLPGIPSVAGLQQALGLGGFPGIEACAAQGAGVAETLQTIMRLTLIDAQRKLTAQRTRPAAAAPGAAPAGGSS